MNLPPRRATWRVWPWLTCALAVGCAQPQLRAQPEAAKPREEFRAALSCELPDNIAHSINAPIPMSFRAASRRAVQEISVRYGAFDAQKRMVAKGRFALSPTDNGDASGSFSFLAPRFGSYVVVARAFGPEGELSSQSCYVGVTPRFSGMPDAPSTRDGDGRGSWTDAARQVWTGLPLMRFDAKPEKLDEVEAQIARAERFGAPYFLQLTDNAKTLTIENVRAVAERFKSRHPVYEVMNEPNFSLSVEEYTRLHRLAYQTIKAVDPQARVIGPSTVNLNLEWLRRFYELGGKNITDAIALHDYEGHESISPEHWAWKFGEVRKIMARHGDARKPLWQTERAIASVRGRNVQGEVGAIRATLHRDLLETLGVPASRNMHYYLNEAGYHDVPTYAWSNFGPLPVALALRTRAAMTSALGRSYAGKLNFGPHGENSFLGVRYRSASGETVVLRNLGTMPTPLDFQVRGARVLNLTDAWGNPSQVLVPNGRVRLTLTQMPLYVRLPRGASLNAPPQNFGRNLATNARVSYSGQTQSDATLLTNGVLETYHDGNPRGGTEGARIWTGDFSGAPQTLTLDLERSQRVSRVVVRGVRADNQFCALLSYDLQAEVDGAWRTLAHVRRPMPGSERASGPDADAIIWTDDTNFFVHAFSPVTTRRVRLIVRDVTRGFLPDARVRAWGETRAQRVMLREVGVYGR